MSNSPIRGTKIQKKNTATEPVNATFEYAGDCCAVVKYAKSEVIQIIERTYPLPKMELEEEKVFDILQTQQKLSLTQIQIQNQNISIKDFKLRGTLGEGSYGTVYLAEKDGEVYALKEVSKQFLVKNGKTENVFRERDILSSFNHPAFTKLFFTFQDSDNLYFALEYVPNGSLAFVLESYGRIPLYLARVYAAQLVNALDYMHQQQIVHRDLKPQNILIDKNYYLKIIDFGESKKIEQELKRGNSLVFDGTRADSSENKSQGSFSSFFRKNQDRRKFESRTKLQGTFVGTPLYAAPEMLKNNQSSRGTDLWALGCIIYELISGHTPFHSPHSGLVFTNILDRNLNFPEYFDPQTIDLIEKLLAYNPCERLGVQNMQDIRNHPFFEGVDFSKLENREIDIPLLEFFQEHSLQMMTLQTEVDDDNDMSQNITVHHQDQRYHAAMIESNDFLSVSELQIPKSQIPSIPSQTRHNPQVDPIILRGEVKVRTHLFFKKKKWMYVTESGTLFISKREGIRHEEEILLRSDCEIKQLKPNRFHIKHKKFCKEIESDDAGVWVCILNELKKKNPQELTYIS